MLVLTRTTNEKIFIGKDIQVIVIRVRGKKVQLGITAPKKVRILREELVNDAEQFIVD